MSSGDATAVTTDRRSLRALFDARSVAILGRVPRDADPEPILARHRSRYGDGFHLVHPAGGTFGGVPVYRSLRDIPGDVDVAVISVGISHVVKAIEECGEKGVPFALVFTSGFAEVGPEGAARERELAATARAAGVRILGPNTNTNVFERMPAIDGQLGGRIGLITQSGHNGRPLVQSAELGVAFSRWVPTGNEVDVDAAEVIEFFAHDEETDVIAGYIEGFKSADRLRQALAAANEHDKPVVLLKIGSTTAGSRMATSHTGHLTGSDAVIDGLFRQHGVTRVRDLDQLVDTAALFAKLPPGTGSRCCLYSISGGSGALMAELAELYGVPMVPLTADTQARLHEIIPTYLAVGNPVDNGGEFLRSAPEADRLRVLDVIAADPNVDVLVVGITGALGVMTDNFAADIRRWSASAPKPVVATWNSPKIDEPGFADLVASRVPLFRSFHNCFAALAAHHAYRSGAALRASRSSRWRPARRPETPVGCGTLPFDTSRALLQEFGVPLAEERLATSADEAADAAAAIGFPVVMKIASPDIPHRSDAGLVTQGVADPASARATYEALLARAKAHDPASRISGVIVQQTVSGGVEMIVGAMDDPVSGPSVMVGTGGVFAEVLHDVAVRPVPITPADAVDMIDGLHGAALLRGARGLPVVDEQALADVVLAVSELVRSLAGRGVELDLNPVIGGPAAAVAVDHLIVVASPATTEAGRAWT